MNIDIDIDIKSILKQCDTEDLAKELQARYDEGENVLEYACDDSIEREYENRGLVPYIYL